METITAPQPQIARLFNQDEWSHQLRKNGERATREHTAQFLS